MPNATKFETKPGKYGTLTRFCVHYTDATNDPACPVFDWFTWAYDVGHAEDRFFDGEDEGWKIVKISKVRAS